MIDPLELPQDLGAIIGRVQSRYIRAAPPREVFDPLLQDVLAWTGSEYGFMAEVLHDEAGAPYLQVNVLTDISWDDTTRAMYERHIQGGPGDAMEFHNMGSLFGAAVLTGQTVISNDPQHDPRRGPRPHGHPLLKSFLGVPLFYGGEMVGLVGLANRPGGFDMVLVEGLQPLFNAVGAIFGAVRSDRERREAEQALREVQQELQDTFDLAGTGLVQLALDGTPIRVNRRVCELLGRSRDEQMRMRTRDISYPEDVAAEEERRRQLIAGEIDHYRVVRRYRHADGHTVWAHVSMTLARRLDGEPDYFVTVIEDVSERQRAEDALRASQQRFLDLVNSVDGIFWEADLSQERFTYVSDRVLPMTGYTVEQWLTPRFWAERVHEDDRERAVAEVRAARRGETHGRAIEYRFRTADGQVIWMSSVVTVFTADDGRPLLRGVIVDATERKRSEEAALAAEAALRANAAKTEFLSRMSHELRTPLNAVLGFAQLLSLDAAQPLSPSQQARVQHIVQAGSHLLAMINDVLDLSRIESGGVSLVTEGLPVQGVVSEALALVATAAADAGVQVQVDRREPAAVEPSICVRADRLRLRQVLVNLLSNAIKYNRTGGQVVLRWPVDAASGLVHLQVEDTGLGLTDAQQEHLFEPFNRLGIERSGIEGTGIGLVITQRLVQLMGGQLSVHSRVGVGSCFTASLPLADADGDHSADEGATLPGALAQPAYTVLYAEDNPMNVELVRQVLKMRPACRLLTAPNGQQALTLAQREQPDLLLVDMHLGDMTGLDLARLLARDPVLCRVPRIVLSADATPDQHRAAMACGYAAYLTKPLDVAALLRCLDEHQARNGPPNRLALAP